MRQDLRHSQMSENKDHKDTFPVSDKPNLKTSEVIYAMFHSSKEGMGYADLTGRFPYRSSRGNAYIMVAYNYDSNAIKMKAIKNREAEKITSTWIELNEEFHAAGVQPKKYILDNECSAELKAALIKEVLTSR